MSLYLDTRGQASASIAICDRCKTKVPIGHLISDPNSPGLRVCHDTCADLYDPYRLPARQTEKITVRYPRPDEPLSFDTVIVADIHVYLTDSLGNNLSDGTGNLLTE